MDEKYEFNKPGAICIRELIGQPIFHTAPAYGHGVISAAELLRNVEINVKIEFENGRETSYFALIKCMSKHLLIFDDATFDIARLQQLIAAKIKEREKIIEEEKRKREEAARLKQEQLKAKEEAARRAKEDRERAIAEEKRRSEKAARLRQEQEELEHKRHIYEFLTQERKVEQLVHFTPLSNVPSILKSGILPRTELKKQEIIAVTPDRDRFDYYLNYSSFSISFPNYRIFYKKRNEMKIPFAVLVIDPQIILDLPLKSISYLPDNAASTEVGPVQNYVGFNAARALFANSIQCGGKTVNRAELKLQGRFPTNPQAEVFIGVPVSPKYIRSVATVNVSDANALRKMLSTDVATYIEVEEDFFKPRVDYDFWKPLSGALED